MISYSSILKLRVKKLNQIQKFTFSNSNVLKNYIGGKFIESKSNSLYHVKNPATQELLWSVPESTNEEFNLAVENSKEAYKAWRNVPILNRQRYMQQFAAKIRENMNELAKTISLEHGKTFPDAIGDVTRGLEVVEQTCNISHILQGETIENAASNIDMYSFRIPLGVTAGICPFNFPGMIPLWMLPVAITCGNTFLLKPSEKTPMTSNLLIEILNDIKLPAGVVNLVHGGKQTVQNICVHKDIKAISFVGSNQAGTYIYNTGTQHGKRVQSNMSAKNHAVICEDADKEDTLNALVNASMGATGQRCMALTTVVFVGKVITLIFRQ